MTNRPDHTEPQETPPRLEDVTTDTLADEQVQAMMAHTIDVAAFAPAIEAQNPADAADSLEELEVGDAAEVVFEMDDLVAARDISEMETPLAVMVLEDLADEHGPKEPARYLGLMDPDNAVDLLQACSISLRDQILEALPAEKAVELEQLSRFDPETAGGMMTTAFIKVPASVTMAEAAIYIRDQAEFDFAQIYCVDQEQRLVGGLSLRQIVVSPPETRVEDVMSTQIDFLRPDVDREEIAEAFERYDYTVMPVADRSGRLMGVVTVDDVLDIIRDEYTEDAYKMVGAGKGEAVYSGLWEKFRGRIPWLIVNLFTSFLAAFVILQFKGLIERMAILAVVMPVIANQAGNAGQQSLAVTLRGLVLGEVRSRHVWPMIWRELALGLVTGSLMGVAVGGMVGLLGVAGVPNMSWQLGLVIFIAMTGSLGVGCLVGTAMPVILERLDYDPATASTIFITMVTDTVSFLTFLGLAWVFQSVLLGGAGV